MSRFHWDRWSGSMCWMIAGTLIATIDSFWLGLMVAMLPMAVGDVMLDRVEARVSREARR